MNVVDKAASHDGQVEKKGLIFCWKVIVVNRLTNCTLKQPQTINKWPKKVPLKINQK